LKDKLGNKSNASSEIEYDNTWARMVGEEGRGVRTILDMVHHTRLDTALAAAGYMRQALNNAINHTAHRTAFQKRLIDQPAMKNVLADLTIEAEAATTLVMRVARAYDEGEGDEKARAFARLAVALAKYWINRRTPTFVFEAMECHGGVGYVEESVMPRLFRESPLNSIWEGSGNVITLDVLRTLAREPESIDAYIAEIEPAQGADRRLDAAVKALKQAIIDDGAHEFAARRLGEAMALVLQGALLVRHAPAPIADAFCASRLGGDWGFAFGTLPGGVDLDAVIDRVRPPL
ncbi:MAG: acyl-CoA dehydrogenase family protein, partial [Candidatus Eiseniibacteriota bacterium]